MDIDAIKDYLISVDCKIEYPILVNAFKKHLYNPDPSIQSKVRNQFKDYVNRLSTVSVENNMKFINLRPEFRPRKSPAVKSTSRQQRAVDSKQNGQSKAPVDAVPVRPADLQKPPIEQSPIRPDRQPSEQNTHRQNGQRPQNAQQQDTPTIRQPFKLPSTTPIKQITTQSTLHTRSVSLTQNTPTIQSTPIKHIVQRSPSTHLTHNIPFTPILPKQMSLLQRNGSQLTTRSRLSQRGEDESDSSSLQPIDPLRRRWAIDACNCNYHNLVTLLREDPKLASCKDIVNGYTALHWAAKFGNLDIIKLLAGTRRVPVNTKSSAGYTPLHIAYMFNRLEAAQLLVKNFQASTDIRDHSGKKPKQYLRQS